MEEVFKFFSTLETPPFQYVLCILHNVQHPAVTGTGVFIVQEATCYYSCYAENLTESQHSHSWNYTFLLHTYHEVCELVYVRLVYVRL